MSTELKVIAPAWEIRPTCAGYWFVKTLLGPWTLSYIASSQVHGEAMSLCDEAFGPLPGMPDSDE